MFRQGVFDHHRLDGLLIPVVSAAAQDTLGPVPEGYCWYLENIAYSVLGNSHTAAVDVAITPDGGTLPAQSTWDHQGQVWGNTAVIRASLNPGSPIYVAPGHFVNFFFSAGTIVNGDVVSVTVQVAVHQLDPAYLMSPEDRRAALASHQHLAEGQVTEVATAGRRAV